jgi:hypothetical protein
VLPRKQKGGFSFEQPKTCVGRAEQGGLWRADKAKAAGADRNRLQPPCLVDPPSPPALKGVGPNAGWCLRLEDPAAAQEGGMILPRAGWCLRHINCKDPAATQE